MKYIIIVSTLFVTGSVAGWLIELFFRRFVSQKKWMNPGFLTGPYLPVYGFGTVILYGVSNIPLGIENAVLNILVKILLIGVMMTLTEFFAGLIFIRGMKIRLWDYSGRKGNVMGIICPAFSLIWLAVGSLYFFFINGLLVGAINFISENLVYSFFIGGVVGMMIVDFAYSLHLGLKLKQLREARTVRFEELKKEFRRRRDVLLTELKSKKP